MRKLNLSDIRTLIETTPTSSTGLRSKLGTMIDRSTRCRAQVDSYNPETGQYRIVLQGTFQQGSWTKDGSR